LCIALGEDFSSGGSTLFSSFGVSSACVCLHPFNLLVGTTTLKILKLKSFPNIFIFYQNS